jgi:hypothetical protein
VTVESVRRAKDEFARLLLHPGDSADVPGPHPLDNVVGVGVGEQITSGRPTGRRAIVVLVHTKFPAAQIEPANRLPLAFHGATVDVQAAGSFGPAAIGVDDEISTGPRDRVRPLRAGCSIGLADAPLRAATLGLIARAGSARFGVTTGHSLAGAVPGDAIVQPARLDGGRPEHDRVATLERLIEPNEDGNIVDCAALRLVSGSGDDDGEQRQHRAAEASVDMIVDAVGRTSDYTVGRVVSIDCDLKIGPLVFRRQILIAATVPGRFALPGDSGAAIIDRRSQRTIGLVFAAGERFAAAHHIADVLDALGLELDEQPAPLTLAPVTARRHGVPIVAGDQPVFTRLAP